MGRELMRHRPARGARNETKPLLESEIIDLVHNAIDIVVERRAAAFDVMIVPQQFLRRMAEGSELVDRQTIALELFEHAHLRRRGLMTHLAPGIGEKMQRPRRGDRRIELTQRTRGGIARIGEQRLACLRLRTLSAAKSARVM